MDPGINEPALKLSICIPTYNRAEFLPGTLESIAAQWTDDLELTVADNASTDDTRRIVDGYQTRLGAVRYFRWDTNQGADRNYLKSVEIATGDYCWILGSDDPIAPGAIATLLAAILDRSPDIVLFNRLECSRELKPIREDRYLDIGDAEHETFDFSRPGALETYLENARSMCATFSYLSSMVFSRTAWNAVTDDEPFVGSAYVHSYKLLVACARGATLELVFRPCLRDTTAAERVALIERIALAATARERKACGISLPGKRNNGRAE